MDRLVVVMVGAERARKSLALEFTRAAREVASAPLALRVRVRLESDAGKVLAGVAVGDAAMVTAVCVWGKPTIGASVRAGELHA